MRDYRRVIEEGSERVTPEDVERAVSQLPEKLERFRGRLSPGLVEDLRTLWGMLRDWLGGEYRKVPWATVAAAAFALLYFINPFDIIPDFLIPAGLVDDATVIGLVLAALKHDLDKYRRWKEGK